MKFSVEFRILLDVYCPRLLDASIYSLKFNPSNGEKELKS